MLSIGTHGNLPAVPSAVPGLLSPLSQARRREVVLTLGQRLLAFKMQKQNAS